ncbi:MAG: hypothetical protein AAFV33_26770, partial [Chloroflexota bacterium]
MRMTTIVSRLSAVVFPSVLALALIFANLPISNANNGLVVAHTGACTGWQQGTCLHDVGRNASIYWASYDRFVDQWSADMGQNVYYDHNSASLHSYERDTNRINGVISTAGARVFSPSISPDGSMIAYTTVDGTTNRIHVVALENGEETIAAASTSAARITGDVRWSPDSRRLAYFTVTNSYLIQAHVVDLTTSEITSLGRVHDPTLAWSPDGTRVAYIPVDSYDSIGIATFDAQNTVQTHVYAAPGMLAVNNVRSGNRISFSPDGEQVMYPGRDVRQGVTSVNTVDVMTGEHTTLSEFNDVEMNFEDAA